VKLLFFIIFFLTTAASAQWTRVPVPTTASLRGLSVVSATTIWASGTEGTVIRSIDAGKNWSVMTIPGAETLDFRGIHAFDDKTALIMSSGPGEKGQARIYRTPDGGATWQQVFEEKRAGIFFDSIAFWDHKRGILLSDPVDGRFALFTTQDGGSSWKQISSTALPPVLPNEGAFAASNSCLTVQGEKNVWFATGGASVARVFRSRDRGQSWSVAETPMHPANASSGIFSLAFADAKNGIGVGGDYAHPESSDLPSVLYTSDSGKSWQIGAATDPAGMYLSSVGFVWHPGKDSIAAAGISGAVISDGGSPWIKESSLNLNNLATTRSHSPTIWAVGPKGIVMRKDIRYQLGARQ
jgi:photosystem II stability/assembly factor-like uncharacterized protein